jgi:hypothetical protein
MTPHIEGKVSGTVTWFCIILSPILEGSLNAAARKVSLLSSVWM